MKARLIPLILLSLISLEVLAQIREPDNARYSKRAIYVTKELDLDTPANKLLDSVFNEYGKTMKLAQMLLNRVAAGKVDAYLRTGRADSFSVLVYDSAKEIADSLYSIKFDKIFLLEQWMFDSINNRLVVRIMKLSPAVKLDQEKYVPTIWIPYHKVRYYLSRHYVMNSKGKRIDLSEYFETRHFTSKWVSYDRRYIR